MSDTNDVGTLYVLANRDMSLAKVGMTRNGTPDVRADSYSREHGIVWHVYWSAETTYVATAELSVHTALAHVRFAEVPGAREIFHLTPSKAKAVAMKHITTPVVTPAPELASRIIEIDRERDERARRWQAEQLVKSAAEAREQARIERERIAAEQAARAAANRAGNQCTLYIIVGASAVMVVLGFFVF